MKTISIKISLIFVLILGTFRSFSQDFEIVNGVQVYFKTTPDMFPANWSDPKYKAHASTPKTVDRNRRIAELKVELAKYPTSVISTYLTKIYFVDSLSFYGKAIDGCYGYKAVYINANTSFFAITFNHEVNSILYYYNKSNFPKTQWDALSKTPYTDNTWEYKSLKIIEDTFASEGFISGYSKTSFSNDMSGIGEFLMAPQPELKEYMTKYPLLKAKFELMKQFYLSIDRSFKFPAIPV